MKRITVLICEDHTVVREGLRSLLGAADDIEVVGEAENGHHALRETKRTAPDVVLMDLAMPLLNGVEATRKIRRQVPAAKVLILSNYGDDQHVQQALAAGAAGYLVKDTAAKDLLQGIRAVSKGKAAFSPPLGRRMLKRWHNRNPQSQSAAGPELSSRQTEVLQLIAEGYSTHQIADLLSLSSKTVEKHRQALMDRLDIHKIATLICYAVSRGIVEARPCVRMAPTGEQKLTSVTS